MFDFWIPFLLVADKGVLYAVPEMGVTEAGKLNPCISQLEFDRLDALSLASEMVNHEHGLSFFLDNQG